MEGNLRPKAISKRIKAKGLQKLKFYCELCEKQCRDENGFKCHTTSEGHQRQMQLFGENPDKFIQDFSQKFEDAFLGHLKFRRGSTRVAATAVYSEYISDRHHVHMNASRWLSLTEFVKYLGRTGKCKVENTEKGWFTACNNGGDNNNGRDKRLRSKFRDELKHEQEIIARQIQRALSSFVQIEDQDPKDGESPNKKVKVAFALSRNNKAKGGAGGAAAVFEDVTNNLDEAEIRSTQGKALAIRWLLGAARKRPGRNMAFKLSSELVDAAKGSGDAIRKKEETRGKKRKPCWLCEGIVVKVVSGKEKNKKGVVKKVLDNCIAEIQMLHTDTGTDDTRVRIHQDQLQTVLPQIGGLVRIVNGLYRGFNARLLAVDTLNFCAQVHLDSNCLLPRVAYEDICKLAI